MSQESQEWLNNMTLIGFTDHREKAWHYQEALQGEEPNHYPEAVPVDSETAAPAVAAQTDAAAPAHSETAPERAADTDAQAEAADVPNDAPPAEEAPTVPPAPAAAPRTQPVPIADIAEVDVAELGLADRLGLGETDPEDEVGPTT